MSERLTRAELSDRLRETEEEWERQELRAEEAEAALEEEGAEAHYWREYSGSVEKDLLRAYHRLQAYDRARIAELEELVGERLARRSR